MIEILNMSFYCIDKYEIKCKHLISGGLLKCHMVNTLFAVCRSHGATFCVNIHSRVIKTLQRDLSFSWH